MSKAKGLWNIEGERQEKLNYYKLTIDFPIIC